MTLMANAFHLKLQLVRAGHRGIPNSPVTLTSISSDERRFTARTIKHSSPSRSHITACFENWTVLARFFGRASLIIWLVFIVVWIIVGILNYHFRYKVRFKLPLMEFLQNTGYTIDFTNMLFYGITLKNN